MNARQDHLSKRVINKQPCRSFKQTQLLHVTLLHNGSLITLYVVTVFVHLFINTQIPYSGFKFPEEHKVLCKIRSHLSVPDKICGAVASQAASIVHRLSKYHYQLKYHPHNRCLCHPYNKCIRNYLSRQISIHSLDA